MKKNFPEASDLDGFEELKPEDQERVTKAYEAGEVDPEDVTKSPEGEDGEEETKKKPATKAKAASKPKKAAAEEDEDELSEEEEKPKKSRAKAAVRSPTLYRRSTFSVLKLSILDNNEKG